MRGLIRKAINGAINRSRTSVLLLVSVAILLKSGSVYGLRYFVKVKNPGYMAQLESQVGKQGAHSAQVSLAMFKPQHLPLSGNQNFEGGTSENGKMSVSLAAAMSNAVIEKTMPTLQAVVLNSTRALDLRTERINSNLVDFIEEEVFYPPLKPFAPTSMDFVLGKRVDLWGLQAIEAFTAWHFGTKGRGVRVLVLDSGIDRDHPALKNNFEKGKNFITEAAKPYEYFDETKHGTHVAGTIAAEQMSSGFSGVAPEAKILAGRICDKSGCSSISIAEGLQWAIDEKVDVVNLSLSGPGATLGVRIAIKLAEDAGIVVVAASGNNEEENNRVGYPAALPTVIAVGAVNNKLERATFSQYGEELDLVAPGVSVFSSVPVGSAIETKIFQRSSSSDHNLEYENLPVEGAGTISHPVSGKLVYVGLARKEDLTDEQAPNVLGIPFIKMDLTGKVVLAQRGLISFQEKVNNILENGMPAAIVIYNNEPGLVHGTISSDIKNYETPVFMILQESGEALLTQMKMASVTLHFESVRKDYDSFDGTSMAAPHVTGVVALIKSFSPTASSLSPEQVRALLKETANPISPNTDNQFGSGVVNAGKAIQKLRVMH